MVGEARASELLSSTLSWRPNGSAPDARTEIRRGRADLHRARARAGPWAWSRLQFVVTSAAKKILEEALTLPEDERAALADALVASLGSQDDLGPEWTAEIARRIDAVERGESHLIAADEVEARIRRALAKV